jgi:hypothetical protein
MGDGGEVLAEKGKRMRHEHPQAMKSTALGLGLFRVNSCTFVDKLFWFSLRLRGSVRENGCCLFSAGGMNTLWR